MTASQYLLDTSREYAIYCCENRAIPHVADGLKHVQRMALWLLKDRAEKLKTVALSGLLSYTRLYVHGDASSNNAIGLMAAPYCNNIPLIEGHGAFGSRVAPGAEGIGAPRYTSVARAKAAQAFLYNDLPIVPMEENYDGSAQQPKHFLPLIPTVLLNGISGIAVGWSTNILPRSLKSLIEATKQALLGQPIKPVVPHYARYDLNVTARGDNQWEFSGKVVIDPPMIRITELPPNLALETLRRRLIEMEDTGEILGFTDRSAETIEVAVKMPRGCTWNTDTALDRFKLRERVTERIVVVDWDGAAIRSYASAEAVIQDFAHWRLGWYTTRFEANLRRDHAELRFWMAVKTLFDRQFPKRLGSFKDRAALEDAVRALVEVDAGQLDRIVSLATYRWTRAFAAEVTATIEHLQQTVGEYQAILASPDRLRGVYLRELDDLKRTFA